MMHKGHTLGDANVEKNILYLSFQMHNTIFFNR